MQQRLWEDCYLARIEWTYNIMPDLRHVFEKLFETGIPTLEYLFDVCERWDRGKKLNKPQRPNTIASKAL